MGAWRSCGRPLGDTAGLPQRQYQDSGRVTYYQEGTSSRSGMPGSLHIRVSDQLFTPLVSPGRCSGRFNSAASEEATILQENAFAVCGLFLSRWPKRNIQII